MASNYNIMANYIVSKYIERVSGKDLGETFVDDDPSKRVMVGIESDFFIDSAGTSNEEHGNPVHRGTQKKLRKEGIPCGNHRARKMCREEYVAFDYIICMERYNIQNIMRIIGNDPEHKVQRLLDYTNRPRDIADPWYTGNFDETFDDVMEGCQAFLSYLMEHLQ